MRVLPSLIDALRADTPTASCARAAVHRPSETRTRNCGRPGHCTGGKGLLGRDEHYGLLVDVEEIAAALAQALGDYARVHGRHVMLDQFSYWEVLDRFDMLGDPDPERRLGVGSLEDDLKDGTAPLGWPPDERDAVLRHTLEYLAGLLGGLATDTVRAATTEETARARRGRPADVGPHDRGPSTRSPTRQRRKEQA